MKPILVTGGAGYIGAHACKALAAAGFEPVVFDDLSNGHRDAVRYGPLVTGDVRDSAALSTCMKRHGVQGVIHFAGLIEVGRSVQDPATFWDVNLNGVASVLAAMRGDEPSAPLAPSSPPRPAGPVDLVAEDLASRPQAVDYYDGADATGDDGDDGDAWNLTGR